MEEILGIILFLLLIGGASALRWWIEKQQRKKEAEEHQLHSTLAQPPGPPPGGRPVFYDRAGEEPRFAVPASEPQPSPAPLAEPLKPLGTIKAAAPVAGPQDTSFLGSLLGGRNVAKAIVLSEILGPPKALRDS
ncbi:MAG: hypothetical protein WBD75_05195 [Phycisphaerae bacterium]